MKYIRTDWDIPWYNLALEEYLLTGMPRDAYLFFYIHRPSVIVGRHQHTVDEINQDYIDRHNVIVARRITGGGAVYHDEGNLNFSFVLPEQKSDFQNFEKFVRPILDALKGMGLDVQLSGRNDLLLDGKKISGNAQYAKNGRILHHGTLLYDTDMEKLARALRVTPLKTASKGVPSVRSRVGNIRAYLPEKISIQAFRGQLLQSLWENLNLEEFSLTEQQTAEVKTLVRNRFSTREWNYGKSAGLDLQRIRKFPCGILDVRLSTAAGRLTACRIYGDFFSLQEMAGLEQKLKGAVFSAEGLRAQLKSVCLSDYFPGLDTEEFIRFLLEE